MKAKGTVVEKSYAAAALEEIAAIEAEAERKKAAPLVTLQAAREKILARQHELQIQLSQIDAAIATIAGPSAMVPSRRKREDLSDLRARIVRWMQARAGETFAAPDLVAHFPELAGRSVATVLKLAVKAGAITTAGDRRRLRYSAAKAR